jgi:general transcription factor 3C polypeptide 3 (transcription factor C subunit 4)
LADDDDADGDDDNAYSRSGDSDFESDSEVEVIQQIDNDSNDLEDDTPQRAELEIEGDFEYVPELPFVPSRVTKLIVMARVSRLIANIRVTDGASGSSMMTKDWDFNIEEKDAEFRDDLRAASGIGRKRRKVR